jgi:type IV secretory pathway VirD2 relaxase
MGKRRPLTEAEEADLKLRRKCAWLKSLPRIPRVTRQASKVTRPQVERTYGRRSVVKVSYARNWRGKGRRAGLMRAHARYLEQAHHPDRDHKEPGFDAAREDVDISKTAGDWQRANDQLHWRLIISPEDVERLDMKAHVREVLAQMEKDLGTNLQWVAIQHENTDDKHVHVLLRGVRDELDRNGKYIPLQMSRAYVSSGIRDISQEIIERQLGPRTEREYLAGRERVIDQRRWTELDRAIERHTIDGVADYGFASWLSEGTRVRVDHEVARLRHLEGMGLAQNLGGNSWHLMPDFKERLIEMQLDKDVIKSRARIRGQQRGMERETA